MLRTSGMFSCKAKDTLHDFQLSQTKDLDRETIGESEIVLCVSGLRKSVIQVWDDMR